jgi:hypothetical protein
VCSSSFVVHLLALVFQMEIMMQKEIQLDNIKFWVDHDIIYCKFNIDFFKKYQKIDIEEIFYNSISILSNGKYLPILINLEEVGYSNSIKIFKHLAHSKLIRGLILSQIFLVRTRGINTILNLHNIKKRPYLVKICRDLDVAIYYSEKENMMFNNVDNLKAV